jgi:hypothetical protein
VCSSASLQIGNANIIVANAEFEISPSFRGDMVEDSLPPWDSTSKGFNFKKREDPVEYSKPGCLPLSVELSGKVVLSESLFVYNTVVLGLNPKFAS